MLISTNDHEKPGIRTHALMSDHEPIHPKIEYDTTNLAAEKNTKDEAREDHSTLVPLSYYRLRSSVRVSKKFVGFGGGMKGSGRNTRIKKWAGWLLEVTTFVKSPRYRNRHRERHLACISYSSLVPPEFGRRVYSGTQQHAGPAIIDLIVG
ncbi:hypothetical protein BDZ45DRAFT_737215 [Acephala macrosclerotiorum]|nr:hypothetical protein BDZ45DRAFT_737215 [Acephala macrosclerotiorum]